MHIQNSKIHKIYNLFSEKLYQRFINFYHLFSLIRLIRRAVQSRLQQHYATRHGSTIRCMQQYRIHQLTYVQIRLLHRCRYHVLQMLVLALIIVHPLPGEDLVQNQPVTVAVHLGAQLSLRNELSGNVGTGTVHPGDLHTRIASRKLTGQAKVTDFRFVVDT